LFTLGYLDLGWMKGALAIVLWPYYLGVAMAG
jgi:acyl-coenzyme A synthetase/AMP-(fatty) acid ligase